MSEFTIRLANKKDIDVITNFNIKMALETENKKLDYSTIFEGVNSLYHNPQYGFYIVAEKHDEILGSLMITTEWSDWRNGLFWWVQSVYVRVDARKQGIYRKMYEFVKSKAKDNPNVYGFRLYVEKDNIVAQKTYQSLGMEETSYKFFEEKIN